MRRALLVPLAFLTALPLLGALACERGGPPPLPPEDLSADAAIEGSEPEGSATAPRPELCAEVEPQECANNGVFVLLSEDPELAIGMFEWSCAEGIGDACSNLVVAYRGAQLSAPAAGVLLGLNERGCAAGSVNSCRMLGVSYYEGEEVAEDNAKARELFDQGCEKDDPKSCFLIGVMLFEGGGEGPDHAGAAAAFERACALRDPEGCKNAGLLHFGGETGAVDGQAQAAALFEAGCSLDDGEACFNLGVVFSKGAGVSQDDAAAQKWMDRACELGDSDACAAVKQLADAADPNAVPGANVSMGSIEVDGMTITNLECRMSGGGGLFGSMALFATLAKKKKAFDKCAPKGAAPEVRWDFAGGKTKVINVEDPSTKVAACVEKVMAKVPATMEASCRATLLIGNKKGAEAAAANK